MTADEINALPQRVREYIHHLETSWGNEARIVQENFQLREENAALKALISELTSQNPSEVKKEPLIRRDA